MNSWGIASPIALEYGLLIKFGSSEVKRLATYNLEPLFFVAFVLQCFDKNTSNHESTPYKKMSLS